MLNQPPTRLHLEITGTVQSVGFRPHCYGLAIRFKLTGWVSNHGGGVSLQIQGNNNILDEFLKTLIDELPPLARITQLEQNKIPVENNEDTFVIRESLYMPVTSAIPPDSNVCTDCLKELFNPESRYYHYAFINCTQCGPRYTVTKCLPYDRRNTAMAEFELCQACQLEYDNPDDRRFHAQATACPDCGPKLSMPVKEITERLCAGQILAIKGLGGYQLICDANNHDAVQTLRKRKNRKAKPFAVMAANLQSFEKLVELDNTTRALLESPQRPIVLATRKPNITLSPAIAPGLNRLGVILPYAPLHYLIFNMAVGSPKGTDWLYQKQDLTLVMTSANPGGEPLVIDNLEADKRLNTIADAIIHHDRIIVTRCDDSVLHIVNDTPRFIRRARSYVPQAIQLSHETPPTLAVGGHKKNTICITRGNEAFLSQHIGDLENRASYQFFRETIEHLLESLDVTPEIIAHDKHPDFFSTQFAQNFGIPIVAVQHHHAHLAAVAAEHGITQSAIGLALDGFGLGEHNQSWGGELLLLEGAHYQRLGYLSPLKQPGADRATREPWRMAATIFERLGRANEIEKRFDQAEAKLLQQVLRKNVNCPVTSSAGRLFDAAAGLLGLLPVCSYEGQAAMMLESLVTKPQVMHNGWKIQNDQLDFLPLLEQLINCDPEHGANLFHGTLIAALSQWLKQTALQYEVDTILLGGGCFLNKILSTGLIENLISENFNVKIGQQAPINDGGLSLGQAWIAGLSISHK